MTRLTEARQTVWATRNSGPNCDVHGVTLSDIEYSLHPYLSYS